MTPEDVSVAMAARLATPTDHTSIECAVQVSLSCSRTARS